jgi:Protein of unknown function (DUF998)
MATNTALAGASGDTTRALLSCAVIAGPLYMLVSLVQAFTRTGFDITRHALSLLTNGDLGWLQMVNFIATGLLITAGAVGMRQALHTGRGRTWAPLLIGVFGSSFVGAGIFKPDPALGFPVGTPADAMTISSAGIVHFAFGGVGFLALIVACFVLARRFSGLQQRGWSAFCVITGIVFFLAFAALSSGSGKSWTFIGFLLGVTLVWVWLSSVSAKLRAELPDRLQ